MSYQQDFIKKIAPMVIEEAKRSKLLPSLTIAQACLETGYGKNVIDGNLFGIKGKGKVCTTKEYINGKWITIKDSFRTYNSWEASIADRSEFLHTVKNGGKLRYQAVIGETDYKKACTAIFKAGYATGKDYDKILISIIESYKLYEYDKRFAQQDNCYIFVGHFLPTEAVKVRDSITKLQSKKLYSESRVAADKRLWIWCGKFETEAKARTAVNTIKGLLGQNTYCEIRKVN